MDPEPPIALALDAAEIVATLREGLLVLTEDLIVEFASARFLATFQVRIEDTLGRALADLGDGQWNIPALLDPLREIVATDRTIEDYEVEHRFEQIGRRVMRLNARKTVRVGNGSKRILLAIDDVTTAADQSLELARLQRLSDGIVNTLREPLLVLDGDLRVIEASRAFCLKFRVENVHTVGAKLSDLGNGQWANPELIRLLTEVIPDRTMIEDFEITHDFPAIGRRTILLNAQKIVLPHDNSQALLLAIEDVTEIHRLDAERQAALVWSNQLLEELNHRVMNSLSMISSVIGMEGRVANNAEARDALGRMRGRITSIATLYRALSRTAAVDAVRADVYLGALLRDMVNSAELSAGAISLDLSIQAIPLSTRIAVPLGLIVNELATNSLKYAYKSREKGVLGMTLTADAEGIVVAMWDDGPGMDEGAPVDSGLGQKLVRSFAQQLGGEIHQTSGPGGTRHMLRIATEAMLPDILEMD